MMASAASWACAAQAADTFGPGTVVVNRMPSRCTFSAIG